MDVVLCHKIIETYTELGETVLDPMAGIDTTGVEAAYMGRNSIAVELEEKFVKITEQNIGLLEKAQTLTPKGKAVVIKGDSRELSKLLGGKADVAVFSPPYTGRSEHRPGYDYQKRDEERGHKPYKGYREGYIGSPDNIGNLSYGKGVDAIVTSPPFAQAQRGGGIAQKGYDGPKHGPTDLVGRRSYMPENVGDGEGNISRMPYGKVDAVITSPPYSESMSKKRKGYTTHPELSKTRHMGLGSSDENIGNLPHGQIDAIVTSPPYEKSISKRGREEPRERIADRLRKAGFSEEYIRRYFTDNPSDNKMKGMGIHDAYSTDPSNIGNLPHGKVDSIITSPPYEKSLSDPRHLSVEEFKAVLAHRGVPEKSIKKIATPASLTAELGANYGRSPTNIGNLKKETYLQAMLQIYRECYKTLKPLGKMVLVIKDFVRAKKVVRLDLDTKKLVESCGFRWVETKLFRLPSKSFWRTLYEKKYPEVDTSLLKFEFVEVFEKPLEACA